MRRLAKPFPVLATILILLLAVVAQAADSTDAARKHEISMGKEAAKEVEKECKLVTDPEALERVERVGQAIAAVANSEVVKASYGSSEIYEFKYKFKVVEDETVNAFSLPGGIIYVHTGLLNYVQSDHELAGVLAHEAAHAAHHHMSYLLKEESRLDGKIALVLLTGMLVKMDTRDLSNLLVGMQLVRIARASGYGQKAEADADAASVEYLTRTGYNPVGVLTFLERLAKDYASKPSVDAGILQTHPSAKDRCKSVTSQIQALGLPINRRAVINALKAITEPAVVNGQQIVRVKLGDKVLFEPAPIENVLTSEQRAEIVATKVNQLLDSEPVIRDVTVSPDHGTVLARREPIIVVTPQDSDLLGKPVRELAAQAADVLRHAVWGEMIGRMF